MLSSWAAQAHELDTNKFKSKITSAKTAVQFFSSISDSLPEFVPTKYISNNFLHKGGYTVPQSPIIYAKPETVIGFNFLINDIDADGYNRDSVNVFSTRTPFTDINLVIASKKEQSFNTIFTANIKPQWNIAFKLLRANGEGFYLKQNMVNNNLWIATNYAAKNSRYQLFTGAITRTLKRDENGGVQNDSLLRENIFANKKLFSVKLQDAKSKRGIRQAFLTQQINIGSKLNADSTHRNRYRLSVYHDINAIRSFYTYSDGNPQSGYYQNVLMDTNLTSDSVSCTVIENKMGFALNFGDDFKWNIGAGYKHQYVETYLQSEKIFFNNYIAEISSMAGGKKLSWNINAAYVLSGYNKSDSKILSSLYYKLNAHTKIGANFNYSRQLPAYFFMNYSSNHFAWQNTFSQSTFADVSAILAIAEHKFLVTAGAKYFYNFTFLNADALPMQYNQAFNLAYINLVKNSNYKHLHFDNQISFQHLTDDSVLRLPALIVKSSLYYQGSWFKNALKVKAGTSVTYYSSFYGNAYMPSLGTFYLQREIKIGNYPFADVFFCMQSGRLKINLIYEHVASGLLGTDYFISPNLPAFDRWLKFNISWTFLD